MSKLNQIYYINLEYRLDRRNEMESWLTESGWPEEKTTRIPAVAVPGRGHIGCTMSHINTLITFLNSGEELCVVFEDDFQPFNCSTFWKDLQTHLDRNIPFDILMIAHNNLLSASTEWDGIHKLSRCYTSSGYVIKRSFVPTLLNNLIEGLQLAEAYEQQYRQKANDYCLDVHWEKLMPVSNLFAVMPALGRQRPSFSDIDGVYANRIT